MEHIIRRRAGAIQQHLWVGADSLLNRPLSAIALSRLARPRSSIRRGGDYSTTGKRPNTNIYPSTRTQHTCPQPLAPSANPEPYAPSRPRWPKASLRTRGYPARVCRDGRRISKVPSSCPRTVKRLTWPACTSSSPPCSTPDPVGSSPP